MERIPTKVIAVLRRTINKLAKNTRANKLPLSWVAGRLAEYPGGVEDLTKALNGRYLGTYKDRDRTEQMCCGGHRSSMAVYHCLRMQKRQVADLYASIPNVGWYRVSGMSWELYRNALSSFPASEQLRTIEGMKNPKNPRRAA